MNKIKKKNKYKNVAARPLAFYYSIKSVDKFQIKLHTHSARLLVLITNESDKEW